MRRTALKPNILYILVDIVIIASWTYIPYILRYNQISFIELLHHPYLWQELRWPGFASYSFLFLFWGLITILVFNNYQLYTTDREISLTEEAWLVLKAVVLASLPILLSIFVFKVVIFSRLLFGITLSGMFVCFSLWRAIKRCIVRRMILKGFHNLNVLIVGAGRVGGYLVEEINSHPYLGLKIIGFLDDYKEKGTVVAGYKVLGSINDFVKVVRKNFIDEVLVTIPSQHKVIEGIIEKSKNLRVNLKIIPDLYSSFFTDIKVYHLGSVPLLGYHSNGIQGSALFFKSLLDEVISGLALFLLSPLFLIIAGLIKLDSPGPIFYQSTRCGRKGIPFVFYKFRSMVKDADNMLVNLKSKNEKKGPIFKMKNDPRITRVGRIIRKFSLDELPQLWNVVKGDMSLVGPRPQTLEEVSNYDFWHMRRLEIKPGITCLWQVRGRSELSFYKWVKWDIWYIDNWSFWLDLKILFWTLPAVIKAKGAY